MEKSRDLCEGCSKWQVCERVTELRTALDDCEGIILSGIFNWCEGLDAESKKVLSKRINEVGTKVGIVACDEWS